MSAVDAEDTLWNLVLQSEDCLLTMESRKEHSLWAWDMDTFLGGCRRKYRQGTWSARVSLLYEMSHRQKRNNKCLKSVFFHLQFDVRIVKGCLWSCVHATTTQTQS